MRNLTSLARGLKFVLAATAVVTVLAFQPGPAAAQTAGAGSDGYARAMWRGTDGEIGLWKLDPALNVVGSHTYGPYAGWLPVAMNTSGSNLSYVLWRNTDGTAMLWEIDPNLNMVNSYTYGPVQDWTAEGLYIGSTGNIGLLWKSTLNQIGVWTLNPTSLNVIATSPVYGPYFGWNTP